MPIALSTPARWPALLFFCVVCLQGCSLLPRGERNATADTASTPVNDSSSLPAFTLEVNAPDGVRETLERHLELQRFRALPDLQDGELQRLLAAADANARELLGTMGYFAPTITVLMTDTPESKAALRAVVVVVEPGPQTRIASTQITVADSTDKDTESHARREQRVQRNWSLLPGQPFTQSAWDSAKADGLRQLQVRRYPTARIAQSRAEVDADTHQAALSVNYDTGPSYRFGPLKVQGSERYDPDGARRLARLPTGAFYDEAQLLDAQLRLASSGYYDAVFLTLDTEGTDPQAAPVVAQLREAKLQKLVFGAGISTDSGPRLSMDHIHNQLPGIGWRAVSKLLLDRETKLASTEWTDLPDENGWRWFASAQAQRETTGDYQVNSARLRSGRSKSGARIDRNYFLQYDYANSQGLNAPPSGTAISVNYGWTGHYFNSTVTPTRGRHGAIEIVARPAIVHADRRARRRGIQALAVGVVVLQKIVAINACTAFAAARAQACAVDLVVARGFALRLGRGKPAPSVFVGQIGPLGARQLGLAVQQQLAYRAPANAGQLVVDMVHGKAGAAVGGDAGAKHQLLQLGLAQLRHHGGGLRVGAFGVEGEKHRVVVTAAGQAQLRIQQLRLVIKSAGGQAGQAPRAIGVIALAALHLQGTKAVRGARVVVHAQCRLVGVGIHLGAALRNAGGGVAAHLKLAQAVGLGTVPGRLGEGLSWQQRPVALHPLLAASVAFGVFVGAVGHGDLGAGNAGLRARLYHHDHGTQGGFAFGGVGHQHRDGGGKVAHGAQQFARVSVGGGQQALQLAVLQIGQCTETL